MMMMMMVNVNPVLINPLRILHIRRIIITLKNHCNFLQFGSIVIMLTMLNNINFILQYRRTCGYDLVLGASEVTKELTTDTTRALMNFV